MAFPAPQVPVSEDLSFLPDAPPASDSASPSTAAAPQSGKAPSRAKPASRRASAGLTPAPKKKAPASGAVSRGGGGSRGKTLGPSDLASAAAAATTPEPQAGAGAVADLRDAETPGAHEFSFLGDVASGVRSVVGSFARVLASPARFAGGRPEKSGDGA